MGPAVSDGRGLLFIALRELGAHSAQCATAEKSSGAAAREGSVAPRAQICRVGHSHQIPALGRKLGAVSALPVKDLNTWSDTLAIEYIDLVLKPHVVQPQRHARRATQYNCRRILRTIRHHLEV